MYGNSTVADDDEIMVYDWKNAAVPRPAGTVRLLDFPTPNSPSTSRTQVAPSNYHSSYNNFSYYNEPQYQRGYTFENSHNHSHAHHYHNVDYSTYWQQEKPTTSNYRANNEFDEWAATTANRPFSREFSAPNFAPSTPSTQTEKDFKEPLCEVDDWFDIEEIDYNDQNTIKQYELKEKEVESSSIIRSPSPTLCVPKSSLPLKLLLPELPEKSKIPLIGASNSRKRPRSEIQKNDSTNLEDFFSKTKQRVSARSYAKPTRKAESIVHDKSAKVDNKRLPSTTLPMDSRVILPSSSGQMSLHRRTVNQENLIDDPEPVLPSIAGIENEILSENNDEENDTQPEVNLRIRTDIFEDEDE